MQDKNLFGTPIPQVHEELFRSKSDNSVFQQTKIRKKLSKIVDVFRDADGQPILDEQGKTKDRIEYPESGGVFVYHVSFPYPEKGARDDTMMMSIQFVKRMLINWLRFFSSKYLWPCYLGLLLLPWKFKIKILETFLKEFLDYAFMVDNHGRHFILEKRYYTAQGRELLKAMEIFLKGIGVNVLLATETALIFTALYDNDTAYYYRIADILSLCDKECILRNPRKEIRFLINTFAERENRPHLVTKFKMFAQMIGYGLFIPKVRRAFKKAVLGMDFSKLGLDEADRYHVRNMGGYNYFGMPQSERLIIWPLTQHTLAEIEWK